MSGRAARRRLEDRVDQILRLLARHGPLSVDVLAQRTGLSGAAVRTYLRRMEAADLIVMEPETQAQRAERLRGRHVSPKSPRLMRYRIA